MDSVSRGCGGIPSTSTCLSVANLTSETIEFRFKETVIPNTQINTTETVQFACEFPAANQVAIVGVTSNTTYGNLNDATSTLVVVPTNVARPPLTSSKQFPFYVVWGLCIITIIIAAIFAKKADAMKIAAYCESENLTGEECDENVAMGNVTGGPSSTPLWATLIVAVIVLVASVVFWMFVQGPLRWASLSECKQRKDYNLFWFWVMPRSGFRKFLCKVFGACECASDVLQTACAMRSKESDRSYDWDEHAAATSKSKTDSCFCCASQGCVDALNGTFCGS